MRYAIGTRAVVQKGLRDFRVVCATCDAGGSTRYDTKAAAMDSAIRRSAEACRSCGAS